MDYETLIENLVFWSKAFHVNPQAKDALEKAATAITDLLVENQSLRNAANGFKARAEAAEARAEKAERERDAAIHDIFEAASAKCFWCKHQDKKWLSDGKMDGLCYTCLKNKKVNWEWRGMKEE